MCVAGLNVSTQPCSHRWYNLVQSCTESTNLANCPHRLKIQGWENRDDSCPWCDPKTQESTTHSSTHRLFGSISSASSSPELGATRTNRSGSFGTISSLSRRSSVSSTMESDRAQRHREMNDRLHLYLTTDPHEVLPSAWKNYPTSPPTTIVEEGAPLVQSDSAASKIWKKRVRFPRSMLSG